MAVLGRQLRCIAVELGQVRLGSVPADPLLLEFPGGTLRVDDQRARLLTYHFALSPGQRRELLGRRSDPRADLRSVGRVCRCDRLLQGLRLSPQARKLRRQPLRTLKLGDTFTQPVSFCRYVREALLAFC